MKESYWQQTKIKEFPKISHDIETDILIIGGGLTGLMCAYYLKDSEYKVTLVERDRIGSHSSSKLTGKVSYFHPVIMSEIKESFSELAALRYFKSNIEAYIDILDIMKKENIDCDFEVNAQYFYSLENDHKLKSVFDMLKGSIPSINYISNQIKMYPLATFDPVKYMKGIVNALGHVDIYEHTTIYDQAKIQHRHVLKANEHKITCKFVIVATRFPIFNFPSMYFLKLHQVRSSLYLTPLRDKRVLLCVDDEVYSRRNINEYNLHVSNERLVGDKAKRIKANDIIQSWDNQDCMSHDYMPLIGYYHKNDTSMFVATGFNKWGVTLSHVAAKLISDLILEKDSEFMDLYEPHRFKPVTSASAFSKLSLRTMRAQIIDRIFVKQEEIEGMNNHSGMITDLNDMMVAVYRQDQRYYGFIPVCSHLGCVLKYNSLEHTFECPCHGSRFDYQGHVLDGPAITDLPSTVVEEK